MATLTEERRSTSSSAVSYRRFLSRHISWVPVFAAVIILVVMIAGAMWYFPNFQLNRIMSSILLDNAYLLVLAVGMTFVILTGGIDLSVGAVMAFTGILCAKMLGDGVPVAVAIPAMVLIGAAIGLLIGILVQFFDVQPFIASLIGMFLARGLAFVVSLESIKVDNEGLLWLQSTRFSFAGWYITPPGSSRC